LKEISLLKRECKKEESPQFNYGTFAKHKPTQAENCYGSEQNYETKCCGPLNYTIS
jgi:hypothetical protein